MKKQNAATKKKKTEVERIKSRQIRLVIIAFSVLAIFALLLWFLLSLIGSVNKESKQETYKKYDAESIEAYIADNWNEFEFISFAPETGNLCLKGDTDYTYEQAEKYGAAVFDEEYLDAYVNLVQQVAIGLSVDCDIDGCTVRLDQYSTDGQIIYSVDSNAQISTCWE